MTTSAGVDYNPAKTHTRPQIRDASPLKRERIQQMLLRYRDALAASTTIPTGSHADRLLMFPPEFNQAMRELDRCLEAMRKHGYQQAIKGVPLKTVRWHVLAWYVDVEWVQQRGYRTEVKNGRKQRVEAGWRMFPRRHRDAREEKALLGVSWLAGEYRWDSIHLHAIQEACGERLAA